MNVLLQIILGLFAGICCGLMLIFLIKKYYIRKDDLLYWLKLKRFETPGAGEEYQEVINYINSL